MSLPQGGGGWAYINFVPIITVPIFFGRVGVEWDRDNVTIIEVFFKASLISFQNSKAKRTPNWAIKLMKLNLLKYCFQIISQNKENYLLQLEIQIFHSSHQSTRLCWYISLPITTKPLAQDFIRRPTECFWSDQWRGYPVVWRPRVSSWRHYDITQLTTLSDRQGTLLSKPIHGLGQVKKTRRGEPALCAMSGWEGRNWGVFIKLITKQEGSWIIQKIKNFRSFRNNEIRAKKQDHWCC